MGKITFCSNFWAFSPGKRRKPAVALRTKGVAFQKSKGTSCLATSSNSWIPEVLCECGKSRVCQSSAYRVTDAPPTLSALLTYKHILFYLSKLAENNPSGACECEGYRDQASTEQHSWQWCMVGWRHIRGFCYSKLWPSPITNPHQMISDELWLLWTSWMNPGVSHGAENPKGIIYTCQNAWNPKLAKALCQCKGGKTTLVK